jgi:archaellum component FlaF (FlaF/FlaG flagellin family)
VNANRIALMFSLALGVAPFVPGCDKTTQEKTTVTKTADGGEAKDVKKETVSPDGKTVTKTEEHTITPPKTPTVTETKDVKKETVSPDGKTVTKTEEHTTTPAKP